MGHRTSDIGNHRHWTLDIGHRTSTSDIGYKLLHFWWFPGLVKKTLWRHDRPYLRLQNPPLLVFFFSPKKAILEQNPPLLVFFFLKILHFWLRKLEKPPLFFFSFNGFFFKTWKTSTFGYENLKNFHFWCFFCLKMDFSSKPPLLT